MGRDIASVMTHVNSFSAATPLVLSYLSSGLGPAMSSLRRHAARNRNALLEELGGIFASAKRGGNSVVAEDGWGYFAEDVS